MTGRRCEGCDTVMIKKFVSNALLSVVMDKKARDKLNALNERRAEPADDDEAAIPRMSPEEGKPPAPTKTPKAQPAPNPATARPPSAMDDDPAALIRDALASAERELERKKNRTHKGKPITAERAALIERALAIHRSKAYILDELDQDQRDKLTAMAMQALNDQLQK